MSPRPTKESSVNELLTRQRPQATIASPQVRRGLSCESQLRVAANLLAHADVDEMSATTVVGVLGRDDENAFQALVTEISDALELDARVRLHVGSFSVRFTRRADADAEQPA